eukprot:TRINITY_DN632_c0_g1_i1.p1 TRINITY_DN632_c0_g1~~TRINITY_DN632_c0_g1_i1.p1  ORF type:complete len:1043 (+),score=309.48 TRINITY_DN632_c0_g1_i1:63-3131(+)
MTLAAVLALAMAGLPTMEHYKYSLSAGGDIQLPLEGEEEEQFSRAAATLGATPFTSTQLLWPNGHAHYYVETAKTNAGNPADHFLQSGDSRITAAVAHWETHTCIRFTKCRSYASCPKPFMYFVSDKSQCNSFVGVHYTKVNQINLQKGCSVGSTIHEIGHALGLAHEQSRNDRDQYVYVDFNQIKSTPFDFRPNFYKSGTNGRDIGSYDYRSIMHYGPTGFAKESLPTIVSPQPIGQRSALSEGDIATIHFMYNRCKRRFPKPTCTSSLGSTATRRVIPYSKPFTVEFNALYGSGMTVSYGGAMAPPANKLSYSKSSGSSLGKVGNTKVTFTPAQAQQGQDYTMRATFTGSDGKAETCSVDVTVADSDTVCFGVASTDPKVCSGRGTCGTDLLAPCTCDGAYGGLQCFGYANCPDNQLLSFDEDVGSVNNFGDIGVEVGFAAKGGGSLRVGTVGDPSANGQGSLTLTKNSKPERITFYMSKFADPTSSPSIYFQDRTTGSICFVTGINNGAWHLNFASISAATTPKTFFFFDIQVDWAASKVSVSVDGKQEVKDRSFVHSCDSGMNYVAMFKGGYYDEFHLWCTSYLQTSGSLIEGITQEGLRAGGATLTLTLVGDHDEWVNTAATKQKVVASMEASFPNAAGWNALESTMLDTSLVSVSGAVLTIGPLRPAPTFSIEGSETVSIGFTADMFTSGTPPAYSRDEASFLIPGDCTSGVFLPFDSLSDESSRVVEVSKSVKKEGAGSLTWTDYRYVYDIPVGGIRPPTASFYGRVGSSASRLYFTMKDSSGQELSMIFNNNGQIVFNTGTWNFLSVTINPNKWYLVKFEFNWATNKVKVKVGGQQKFSGSFPSTFKNIATLRLSSTTSSTGVYIDSIRFTCPVREPLFDVSPSCPVPGEDAPVFHIYQASDALSPSDHLAIVPATATDCSSADVQCSALDACSSSVGSLVQVGGGATEWSPGTLPSLSPQTEYKMCYYPSSHGSYIMLDSTFTTCGSAEPTSAPDTDAPDTDAPDTDAPDFCS